MCKAAVFGRTRSDDQSTPPQSSPALAADAKLARERKRAKGAVGMNFYLSGVVPATALVGVW